MKRVIQPQASYREPAAEVERADLPGKRLSELLLDRLSGAGRLQGLHGSRAALVFSRLFRKGERSLVWVCRSNQAAEEIARDLRFFLSEEASDQIVILPAFETSPYRGLSPHPELAARRSIALSRLSDGFQGILIVPLAAALQKMVSPDYFRSRCLDLKLGDAISRDELIGRLRALGYVRDDPVSEMGEFSFRGGIVDLFSPSAPHPVRVEFFGEEIESLRHFDPSTQRSIGLVSECSVVPMRELTPSQKEIEAWHREAPLFWNEVRFASRLQELMQFTENGELFNGFEHLFPLVVPTESDFLDHAGEHHLVMEEPEELLSLSDRLWKAAEEGYEDCSLEGSPALPPGKHLLERSRLEEQIASSRTHAYEQLSPDGEATEDFDFRAERNYQGRVQELLKDIQQWRESGEQILMVMPSDGMVHRLRDILAEYDCAVPEVPGFEAALDHSVAITRGRLGGGFHSPRLGLHILTEDQIFGERKVETARPPRQAESVGTFISDFRDLHEGDYVVHVDHGIGRFQGLERIGVGEQTSEFVVVEYSGGSKLYVPIDRLDLIQKYSSGGVSPPSVDRLGGASWKKTKARIKKSMQVLAEDLLKLYARREVAEGHAFAPDDALMQEFEEAFEYVETPDQRAAIQASKRDMESARPMDRLICGDVGYGKTEVAMRAAFKAVNDGKQVSVLAPTTVLAFQHRNTFGQRFQGFPVRIEMLSRFLSRSQQKEVSEQTRLGMVDILIGTHRLLSRDIHFPNLGLIIVDEEQRFGVAQKEKLKKLKAQVDVLTLSATPIPRTLNMSLVGIRDLSIIETPPKDRLAIQTVVTRFGRTIIESAVDLELKRSGQVFFLHNSVETIYSVAKMVQETVPEARVAVAHGQMREDMLEEVMLDFLNHRYDVLVCTTIIENGLDMPRANTIIINQADRFGLSQLYQLRGRVGRSNRRAYAYLLISGEDTLSTVAKKRLAAIREFSDLGSGFRLAALDLEIRGAGNLLGGEQSGHIEAVGFELYMKLLEQSIQELKGEPTAEEVRPSIDLKLDIQIPDHYIDDSNMRLWLYKRVSTASSEEKLENLRSEIVDRFGRYPKPVSYLLDYARLRLKAEPLRVKSLERKGSVVILKFREDTPVDPESAIALMQEDSRLSFSPDGSLRIHLDGAPAGEAIDRIAGLLDQLGGRQ